MNQFKKILLSFLILFAWPAFSQEKADFLILNKKYGEALAELERAFVKAPSATILYKKGVVYKLQQQYQDAAEAFFAASEMAPENAEILGELAETLNALDNNSDAAAIYSKACLLNPDNFMLAAKLGATYISLKDFKNALDVFTRIYRNDSTNVFWNKQYAFCLAKIRGNDSLAIRLYGQVIAANPRDAGNYSSLYTLYVRNKNEKDAAGILLRGLSVFRDNPDLMLKIANHHLGNKNYQDAAAWYQKYLSASDVEYEILRNYGISLYFCKAEKEAIGVFDQCMQLAANDPIVLFYESLCYKKMADYTLAEGFMKTAIEAASPAYLPEMYHHLGQIYGQQRKFEESIGALQKAYESDTTDFEILFEIATTFEEFSQNKTLALNYYRNYLIVGGEAARNVNYALTRIERIKEDLFFKE